MDSVSVLFRIKVWKECRNDRAVSARLKTDLGTDRTPAPRETRPLIVPPASPEWSLWAGAATSPPDPHSHAPLYSTHTHTHTVSNHIKRRITDKSVCVWDVWASDLCVFRALDTILSITSSVSFKRSCSCVNSKSAEDNRTDPKHYTKCVCVYCIYVNLYIRALDDSVHWVSTCELMCKYISVCVIVLVCALFHKHQLIRLLHWTASLCNLYKTRFLNLCLVNQNESVSRSVSDLLCRSFSSSKSCLIVWFFFPTYWFFSSCSLILLREICSRETDSLSLSMWSVGEKN